MRDNSKLNQSEKFLILRSLSEFESVRSIQLKLFTEHKKHCSLQNLYAYQKRYESEIAVMRESFLSNLAEIPLSHKSYRLKTLQRILDASLESGRDLHIALKCVSIAQREYQYIYQNEKNIEPVRDSITIDFGENKTMEKI